MKKILYFIFFSILLFSTTNVYAYNEAVIDITKMDIFEIQEAIDNKFINYETLIKLYLDRIDEYNSKYKAIITVNENILEEAKKCDEEYKKNGRKSYLFCMPIIVKDNIDVVGMPTTVGTKSLSDSYPKEDAEIIKNLKEKGALIIGKANMSEFAFSAQTSESSYGTVKNAYNLYNLFNELNCFNEKDLLKAHGILTYLIDKESGIYINHGEGVFDGDKVIFVAPSETMVPKLMKDLFDWRTKRINSLQL